MYRNKVCKYKLYVLYRNKSFGYVKDVSEDVTLRIISDNGMYRKLRISIAKVTYREFALRYGVSKVTDANW
jgi:hypothetical protein